MEPLLKPHPSLFPTGATWSAPVNITNQVLKPGYTWYATGPPASLVLPSGRILVPSDHETSAGYASQVAFSDDNGHTWQQVRDAASFCSRCSNPLSLCSRTRSRTATSASWRWRPTAAWC